MKAMTCLVHPRRAAARIARLEELCAAADSRAAMLEGETAPMRRQIAELKAENVDLAHRLEESHGSQRELMRKIASDGAAYAASLAEADRRLAEARQELEKANADLDVVEQVEQALTRMEKMKHDYELRIVRLKATVSELRRQLAAAAGETPPPSTAADPTISFMASVQTLPAQDPAPRPAAPHQASPRPARPTTPPLPGLADEPSDDSRWLLPLP